jgi:Bacteriophage HK97-gp10, putative tail-component
MAMGSFTMQLQAFQVKTEKQIKASIQKIAMEVFKRVIEKSPVDTGRFRANWGCSIGSPYVGTYDITDKDGNATKVKIMQIIAKWDGTDSIYLCNSLPYSLKLEFGSSKQAPGGMVRLTIAEMQNGAAEQAAKG